MTIRTRLVVFGLAAMIPVACSDVNPNGPSVSFTAPTASGPSNGASYKFNQQPITLTITNAARSAPATVTYNVEVSTSSSFAKIANPDPAKCSLTICIFKGFRKSGLSDPYHSSESR